MNLFEALCVVGVWCQLFHTVHFLLELLQVFLKLLFFQTGLEKSDMYKNIRSEQMAPLRRFVSTGSLFDQQQLDFIGES